MTHYAHTEAEMNRDASIKELSWKHRVEYYVVNMSESIGLKNKDVREFMKIIDEISFNDLSFLEIEVLQAIINFKWETYTKNFFMKQFVVFFCFIIVLIVDLIFGNEDYGMKDEALKLKGDIGTKVIC